jgi:hypothetical protein
LSWCSVSLSDMSAASPERPAESETVRGGFVRGAEVGVKARRCLGF